MTGPKGCLSELDWSCDGMQCELSYGHDGDHFCSGNSGNASPPEGRSYDKAGNRVVPDFKAAFEFRWREAES